MYLPLFQLWIITKEITLNKYLAELLHLISLSFVNLSCRSRASVHGSACAPRLRLRAFLGSALCWTPVAAAGYVPDSLIRTAVPLSPVTTSKGCTAI